MPYRSFPQKNPLISGSFAKNGLQLEASYGSSSPCTSPVARGRISTHIDELWHVWGSHGTHMNESWHTYEWVMAHIWMSHSTHMNESCHTYEWVMWHIWMSHVTHMNESWHPYRSAPVARVRIHLFHMWSWYTCEWVMAQIWVSHGTYIVKHPWSAAESVAVYVCCSCGARCSAYFNPDQYQ